MKISRGTEQKLCLREPSHQGDPAGEEAGRWGRQALFHRLRPVGAWAGPGALSPRAPHPFQAKYRPGCRPCAPPPLPPREE